MEPRICIFAKAPVAGQVKTRLAAEIGDTAALAIYLHMLSRTIMRLTAPGWRTELWVTPDDAARTGATWPGHLPRMAQGDGDLGQRMARPLRLARPDAPVIVVGSDIPALAARHVDQALQALRSAPMAFGPSRDGGFYLVASRAPPPPGLFAGVTWSSETTLSESLATCAEEPALIETLDDLDDLAALERHRAEPDWRDLGDMIRPDG